MQDTAVQSRHVNNCNLQDYYHWKRGNRGSYMVVILLLLFSFPSGEILYFFPLAENRSNQNHVILQQRANKLF